MTLEAVRDSIRYAYGDGGNVNFADLRRWADALDAHLSHAAEPVGEVIDVAGTLGEMRVIRWRAGYAPPVGTKLFAHPSEDGRDAARFDFAAHLQRQRDWSGATFGPGPRAIGVVDHIRKELREIEADPGDLKEWIDVVILALDGAWRSGASPADIIAALVAKQTKNEGRTWPDWRTADPNKAIEHDRSHDAAITEDSRDGD
jgi:hypothetical protein